MNHHQEEHSLRNRARELGIHVGILPPGHWNSITDVAGVRVGHVTIIEGEAIRTGVTAILPHGGNHFQEKLPAAAHIGNGFGKMAGYSQLRELGTLETPIILTNTLAIAAGIEGLIRHTLSQPGNENVRSVNSVVGETSDAFLNDIRALRVTAADVRHAINNAKDGPVEEGAVGAGTGTSCFGFKGGIGTSSRRVPRDFGGYTVGVLVQSNYEGILTLNGAPVGRELGRFSFSQHTEIPRGHGSCMIVVATDAPLDARNLERLARRATIGLGRTGSVMDNGSGDFVIAFSTAYRIPATTVLHDPPVALVSNSHMDPLFLACAEATEEALYNSLFMATSITGRDGNCREAIPLDRVVEICRRHQLVGLLDRLSGIRNEE
ncbi:P1 family peptidase [Candidatus Sumerlaeota bacterium]|nr:P1 family peptidase [Candidatus Sumerlaeota bacterium]